MEEPRRIVDRDRIKPEQQTEPCKEQYGVCIECAVRNPYFRQVAGRAAGEDWLAESLNEAFMNGRRFIMLPSVGTTVQRCRECGRIVASLYAPAE